MTARKAGISIAKKKFPERKKKNSLKKPEIITDFESQIQKLESEAPKILSFSRIGLWMLNYKTNALIINSDAIPILGFNNSYSVEFKDFLHMITKKEERDLFEKKIQKLTNDELPFDFTLRIRSQGNEKKTIKIVAGILDESHLGGSLTDITENWKLDKELIKAKNKAEKADQFKSAFLTNLSHELRTPMNAIIGFTELLSQNKIDLEQKSDYTKIIKNKANYLLSLIDDINELSKFETGIADIRKSNFLLFPLLEELFDEFDHKRKEAGKYNVLLSLALPDELRSKYLSTDQGRLYQLFSILLSNAIKFTEKGLIEFGVKVVNDSLKFFVNDTGIGMTEEEQKNVFYRFSQIEETTIGRYGRTGFSLTIARYIVEKLGGSIKVKSELSIGSRFQFALSDITISNESDAMKNDTHITKENNWKNKLFLIAEDEEVNYKFLETVLQRTQAQVLRAKTGLEAVELCQKIPQIDLVLMDIKMPVMNGYEASKKIKAIRPNLPIIAQTAFSTQEEINKCLECGCEDYIIKPIDISLLFKKINDLS
jgi:signal transduction histidine kinase/CheY-like chemotaxis protein